VLIADPEPERARRTAGICTDRGFTVENADQGAVALERSIESPPDLLVCALDLPIIDGAKLAEILRNNPRTRAVVVVYLLEDALDAPVSMDVRDRIVLAPWHREQLVEQIDAALERGARLTDDRPEHEIEGSLAQISLVDLLQLLQLNKKTGVVRVLPGPPHAPGTALLRDGEIVDATVSAGDGRPLHGLKALYRLLGCRRGRFEFTPRDPGGTGRIQTQTRELLLKGLSQMDEGRRIRQSLPAVGVRVHPERTPFKLPPAEQAIAADVLKAVEGESSVQEILDRLSCPDYPILRTLQALLAHGVLEPATAASSSATVEQAPTKSLLTREQATRIRDWAAAQRPPVRRQVRVPIIASDSDGLCLFVSSIRGFQDATVPANGAEPSLERVRPLAEISLGEGLVLSLVGLPSDPRFRPLWPLTLRGTLGALVLVVGPETETDALAQQVRETLVSGAQPVVPLRIADAMDSEGESASSTNGPGRAAAARDALTRLVP
jgi:CheY-like chemotaxis protein